MELVADVPGDSGDSADDRPLEPAVQPANNAHARPAITRVHLDRTKPLLIMNRTGGS
jgi:hypothetical protein